MKDVSLNTTKAMDEMIKDFPKIKTSIDKIISELDKWQSFIEEHEEEFIENFCRTNNVMFITNVSWNSESMEITYIIDEGSYICDSFKISDWIEFLNDKG